jgi:NADH-quinone oxidoreductase subunit N
MNYSFLSTTTYIYYFSEIIFTFLIFIYLFIGTLFNNHPNFFNASVIKPISYIFITNLFYILHLIGEIFHIKPTLVWKKDQFKKKLFLYLLDNNTIAFKLVFIFFLGIILILLSNYLLINKITFEYLIVLLLSALGSLILISANDLFYIYLAIELQTFAFFILIVLDAKKSYVVEAGIKYFVLSAIASGFYLIGVLYIYYTYGVTNLQMLSMSLKYNNYLNPEFATLTVGVAFIVITLLFKLALVPFHNWIIDVYAGTKLETLIFLSILPKISIFAIFYRLYQICFIEFKNINYLFIIVAILSILVGSLGAISEYKIKRVVAYSSIVNSSFLLLGLCLPFIRGFYSAFLFMFIYFLSVLGFLGYIFILQNTSRFINVQNLHYISSIFFVNPTYGLNVSIYFFTLAGLPPFLSFFTKFYLLYNLSWWVNLFFIFIIFLVNLLAFYFYIRFVRLVLFFNYKGEYIYKYYTNVDRISSYILLLLTNIQLFFMYYSSILVEVSNHMFIISYC